MKRLLLYILIISTLLLVCSCKVKPQVNEELALPDLEQAADSGEQVKRNSSEQKEISEENTVETENTTNTLTDNVNVPDDVIKTEQSDDFVTENNTVILDEKEKVNQLALELEKHPTGSNPYPEFVFTNITDMINTIKTREYTISNKERIELENRFSKISDEQQKLDRIAKIGTKNDMRFERFKTDDIKYFFKIKDIPEYTLSNVYLGEKHILYCYVPLGKEKINEDDILRIKYLLPTDFVTDSYFDDYIEYHNVKNWNLVGNDSVISSDDHLYIKFDKSESATIIFPVENTIIEIRGHGDMANYEALKKLCVAEKVVVK